MTKPGPPIIISVGADDSVRPPYKEYHKGETMNLLEETKYMLKKYGMSANKGLGQNFLVDENTVQSIVDSANITSRDLVIEIGPGLGTLTAALLENAGKVIAIELDDRMIPVLQDRFKLYNNFEIIHDDILKVDLEKLITENIANTSLQHTKIVANLPYYITTPIIMKLLEEKLPIESITVMVQKEVAQRLTATPGKKNAGAITYSVYYYAEAHTVIDVPRERFMPSPNVDSQVIQLSIRKEPPVQVEDETTLFELIKYAFMQRRKTLVNALEKSTIFENKNQIISILQNLDINEKIRGEALTMEQFSKIANALARKD